MKNASRMDLDTRLSHRYGVLDIIPLRDAALESLRRTNIRLDNSPNWIS
jgi:hypothetical protein